MLALLYARVSTRHLQDDNFSIETQLPAMRKLATELGATNLMEFVEYESAFDEGLTRTELNRLLEWVRKSGGDLLIFYSSDRFTRDIADGVILRRELYKLGIKLYCCYPFPQEVRSENELVNILTDWQSQQYVEKLREASMRGYKGKLESGAFSQGTAPYGYRIEGERHDSHLVPALPQAEIVQMIFSWFVLEDYTTRQIAQKLTDMGLPTPGEHINRSRKRPSGKWAPTTVYSILYEEVYAGIWYGHRIMKVGKNKFALRPRSEWIPIAVEPLVPREMWQAAQEKLQARRHNRNAKRNYLMGRRLYCGCGYSFVGGFRTRKRKGPTALRRSTRATWS